MTIANVIISLAIVLFGGFMMTRVTKILKLPNVTAYIVAGILLGPHVLKLVPQTTIDGMSFLPDIALAFIAFSTGEFFRFSTLKKNGMKVVVITVLEALLATVLVFLVCYYVLKLDLAFSLVLGALASATAPASTVMTIRQTGAKGDFVETLLQVVALDDVVGLVAYSVAISVAVASLQGSGFELAGIIDPIVKNIIALLAGCLVGFIMSFTIMRHNEDNRLIVAIAWLIGFCGACAYFDISPLLGCMAMATVYINIADDVSLFRQLNYWTPPILLMFFVRSGMNFNLDAILHPSGAIGDTPLLVIGVVYFIVRIIGKYAGAYLGCGLVGKEPKVKRYLGLALIPQAGVAIGLAALGARTLGGETGEALETIILASSVLYELIGPACGKLSLYLSGSYTDGTVEVEVPEEGQLSEVELLKARIKQIQSALPEHPLTEEEAAFNGAAEEYYNSARKNRARMKGWSR